MTSSRATAATSTRRNLFDTFGDSAPGGDDVDGSWELVKLSGPHPSFETELCDIAGELIG